MYFNDQIPIGICHILEADISQDSGIVQQYINSAEGVDCSFYDFLAILDAVVICYSFAASGTYFIDNYVGSLRFTVSTIDHACRTWNRNLTHPR